MPEDDPFKIAEDFLERTGKGLMTGDFAIFAPCFRLPQVLRTFDGIVRIESQDGLERAFRRMHETFTGMGATALLRSVVAAEFEGPDRIAATHESLVVRHGNVLKGPYPVLCELVRVEGVWLIDGGDYALEGESGQARAMMAGAPKPEDNPNGR